MIRQELGALGMSDEVVASQGVVGRFGGRYYVYPYYSSPQRFPVKATTTVFVLAPYEGRELVNPLITVEAVNYLVHTLKAQLLVSKNGIYVVEWRPPPGTLSVALP